ncbi:hypothetical protein ECZU12_49210 [Escherichia coli]|nr:hypothetical protein ECZU12_49210 [Escherichia coli]
MAIVVYSGQYVENGVKELPAGQHDGAGEHSGTRSAHLWLHSGCGRTARRHSSARYPKNWVTTGDPAREFTMIQSAPLMLLADPDAFVSVQLA